MSIPQVNITSVGAQPPPEAPPRSFDLIFKILD